MFWQKKKSQDIDDSGDEKPKYKKPGREIWGFRCTPSIHTDAKVIAKELHVDLEVLVEHCVQLGLIEVNAARRDPQDTELLRNHLNEEHKINHLVESVSGYDEEAARYIREGQSRRYYVERICRDLVFLCEKYRIDPRWMRAQVIYEIRRIVAFRRSRAGGSDNSARTSDPWQNFRDVEDKTTKGPM